MASHDSHEDNIGAGTTLMFKNIPCRYTQEEIKAILDEAGFQGQLDLVYLPRSITKASNLGYAFVNFRFPEAAERCRNAFNGKPLGGSCSTKLCQVLFANVQGGMDALTWCRNSRKVKRRAKPLVINELPPDVSLDHSESAPRAHAGSITWLNTRCVSLAFLKSKAPPAAARRTLFESLEAFGTPRTDEEGYWEHLKLPGGGQGARAQKLKDWQPQYEQTQEEQQESAIPHIIIRWSF